MSVRSRLLLIMMMMILLKDSDSEDEDTPYTYRRNLSLELRRRRDRRIPRVSLLRPRFSPWEHLYTSGDQQAMITITGFDYESFAELEALFSPYFLNHTPYSRDGVIRQVNHRLTGGRPRINSKCICC